MNFLFKIIDFFYQKEKYSFLKKRISKDINILIDVGAHHGDTIVEFLKIFSIKKIYAFEPSKKNFDKLKIKVKKIERYNPVKIKIFQFGLGKKNDVLPLYEITDSVSNTFNNLNSESKYFKKKNFLQLYLELKNLLKIVCQPKFFL